MRKYANLGQGFEESVKMSNTLYKNRKICNVQKISTPWNVIRQGNRIVNAYPEEKSTLDFRGTIKGGIPISFDCKETEKVEGLPLQNIEQHQIDYMREALELGELSFLLVSILPLGKAYFIDGYAVLRFYDTWRDNLRKRGFNIIPVSAMTEVKSKEGVIHDYIPLVLEWRRGMIDGCKAV